MLHMVEVVEQEIWKNGSYFSSGRFRNADTGQVLWDEIAKSNSGVGGTWSYGGGYSNAPDVQQDYTLLMIQTTT